MVGSVRLGARLIRDEIRAMSRLPDGGLVVATREWVYYCDQGERPMRPAEIMNSGQEIFPPICIHVDPHGRVIWGEYDSSHAHGQRVRIFRSLDRGATYEEGYAFDPYEIRHVHNLRYDAEANGYWVFAGDKSSEPGIGFLSDDLRKLDWVAKGEQKYRTVDVFDLKDHFVYGTDSELERNAIVSFDKKTGRVDRLQEINGSCIYSCRFGGIYAVSTSVEPSHINTNSNAELWLSRDGHQWSKCYSCRKDIFPPRYFQFGSIVLPRGTGPNETIIFSGQALTDIDNRVLVANWNGF